MSTTYAASFNIIVNKNPVDQMIDNIKNGNPPDIGDKLPLTYPDGSVWEYIAADINDGGDVTFLGADALYLDVPYKEAPIYNEQFSYAGATTIRNYFNVTLFNKYPESVRNAIKAKTSRYSYPNYNSSTWEESTDKVWLPSTKNLLSPDVTYRNNSTGIIQANLYQDPNSPDKTFEYLKTTPFDEWFCYSRYENGAKRYSDAGRGGRTATTAGMTSGSTRYQQFQHLVSNMVTRADRGGANYFTAFIIGAT